MNENELMPIAVDNPNGNIEKATATTVAIQRWGRAVREHYEAIEPNGEKAQQEVWTALKKLDGMLKETNDALVRAVGEATASDRILVQIAAERKAIKALYEEKWGKFVEIRDKDKVVVPPTSWVLDVYANEEQLTALAKAAKKLGIPTFRWAKPQTDKAKNAIIKFFEENI